ncbi:FAD-binding oxidoreductase [Thermococcus sp. GR7]|uniref:NAD(P)/FAD-dependent oxidoreductase n=1 Tax=unclassified Thermococcus TaxID=2627626 RepID=UPI0014302125|nr:MULTISPECIES: FAD-binding oxidoreductase [unclassified Thermococcus]NJE46892.1 FAD-binding oxidoreductase [Thermococcus sp. GR7]NJE78389.1 FAD-binding oxidoreductase [Thermococcus sp. GR4]NJF23314.1 FAD-binding oxidoreductase [Thermococcus sp. GR5]
MSKIAIIGGGIIGVATAYELAKLGEEVILFEKNYFGSGSTFRCATGIRAQFTDEANIRLMKYAIERWERLEEELGAEIGFRHSGYLFLATSEEEVEAFKNNIKLQNSFGVPTRLIDMDAAKEIVPPLNTEPFLAGAWNPMDGKANPFKTLFAYLTKAKEMGVDAREHTEVVALEREGDKIIAVKFRSNGKVESVKVDALLNAANAWAPLINEMAGLSRELVPITAYKHQLVKTEPLKPGQVEPLVCPPSWNDSYLIQDGEDGGIICGSGIEHKAKSLDDYEPTYDFLRGVLKYAVQIIPAIRHAHIVRQWAGFYAKTPDKNPAIGRLLDNFYIAAGFSGHGFMMAPAVAQAMAEFMTKGKSKVPLDWEWYDPYRFERGELRSSAFQIG